MTSLLGGAVPRAFRYLVAFFPGFSLFGGGNLLKTLAVSALYFT